MDKLNDIKRKLAEIERLFREVRKDVAALERRLSALPAQPKAESGVEISDPQVLRAKYEELFNLYVKNGSAPVQTELGGLHKTALLAFCKANSIPLSNNRAGKAAITREIIKQMRELHEISRKAT